MIYTEADGQQYIEILLGEKENGIFLPLEKDFIKDLVGKRYSNLSARQKQVVFRLVGWLRPQGTLDTIAKQSDT